MNLAINSDNISEYSRIYKYGFRLTSRNIKISDPSDGSRSITVFYVKKGIWIPEINYISVCTDTHDEVYIDSILLTHTDYYPHIDAYLSHIQWTQIDQFLYSDMSLLGVFDSKNFAPDDDEWYDYCWDKVYNSEDRCSVVDGGLVAYLPHQYAVYFLEDGSENVIGLYLERVFDNV